MVASFSLGAWKVRTGSGTNDGELLAVVCFPAGSPTVAFVTLRSDPLPQKTPPFVCPSRCPPCPKTFKVLKHGGTDYNLLKTWCLLGLLRAFEEYFEVGVAKCVEIFCRIVHVPPPAPLFSHVRSRWF